MPITNAVTKTDEISAVSVVLAALEGLNAAGREIVLDFTGVQRIDAAGLQALEQLAARAGEKSVALTIRGVNVDVYKVLKLVKLSAQFQYLN